MHVPANPPELFCCVDGENITYKMHVIDPATRLVFCSAHKELAHLDDFCSKHFQHKCSGYHDADHDLIVLRPGHDDATISRTRATSV